MRQELQQHTISLNLYFTINNCSRKNGYRRGAALRVREHVEGK